jgi:hypothetical protein
MQQVKAKFPVLVDADERVADLYRAYGVPQNVVIQSDGVVSHRLVGGEELTALRALRAATGLPNKNEIARTGDTAGGGLEVRVDVDEVVVHATWAASSRDTTLARNSGRWTRRPDGMYLDETGRLLTIASAIGPPIDAMLRARQIGLRLLETYATRVCPASATITASALDSVPKMRDMNYVRNPLYKGWPLGLIAEKIAPCKWPSIEATYVWTDVRRKLWRILYVSGGSSHIYETIEFARRNEDGSVGGTSGLVDHLPELRELLKKQRRIIKDALQ